MKSSTSHTSGPVLMSQSQAYELPITKSFCQQRKSKMSSTPFPAAAYAAAACSAGWVVCPGPNWMV